MKRDNQRAKAYRYDSYLQSLLSSKEKMKLDDCAYLIAQSLKEFRLDPMKPPLLKDGRGCRIARGGATVITLPRWARDPVVTLHEASHCIIDRCLGNCEDLAAHGPEWLRVYIHLASIELNVPEKTLEKVAKEEYGLKVGPSFLITEIRKISKKCPWGISLK